MKLLTEIGSEDFGKLEVRSPKIKKAPQKPQELLRHLNPTAGSAPESPPHSVASHSRVQRNPRTPVSFGCSYLV
ncbi:hypothetical protein [Microcoleus vaginatus]|uniref:hypothetical protein n=1 Tax=Microcoleus vaginatus TaxID=119532 RepID=UPI001F60D4CA|nr:hypothetical protein D0A37_21010 [Microcoleus vaginatus HSN003]